MSMHLYALVTAAFLLGGGGGFLVKDFVVDDACDQVRIMEKNNDIYEKLLDDDVNAMRDQSNSPGIINPSPDTWGR